MHFTEAATYAGAAVETDAAGLTLEQIRPHLVFSLWKTSHQEALRSIEKAGSDSPIGACLPSWIR